MLGITEQGYLPVPYGYAPSLLSIISEHMGRKIEVQIMPYLRTLHALKTGQVDIGFGLRVQGSSVHLPENIVTASEPQLILPTSIYALPERNIKIENLAQADHYRLGTVRLESKAQRIQRTVQNNVYYYKDVYSLSKALLAHYIDLATQELGVALERLYDYNHLEIFPVFSNASPRIKNPLDLCQRFVEARIETVKSGTYETLLIDSNMEHLRPYYNHVKVLAGHCRITTSEDQNPDAIKNTSP